MAPPTKYDWARVDWSQPSDVIARQIGAPLWTVISYRSKNKMPMAKPRPRPQSALDKIAAHARTPERRAKARATQPIATAAAKASPLAGRGVGNIHAKRWQLLAPDGAVHIVVNLYEFVRANAHLFAEADVTWKRTGGRRGTGGEWCNATAGILNIKAGRAKSWKGWRLGDW